jgi:hypothetical protein
MVSDRRNRRDASDFEGIAADSATSTVKLIRHENSGHWQWWP